MSAGAFAVSGCNGFVGRHLVAELARAGHRVVGLGREAEPSPDIAATLADYQCVDLTRSWPAVDGVDGLVHLAGHSNVAESFDHPQRFIADNSAAVTHLGEHLLTLGAPPRALVISSGAVYDTSQPVPIPEEGRTFPSSPYVVSKLLVENQCTYYATRGAPLVTVRPFNHIGPGQQTGFLLPDLVRSAREARATGSPLVVGDLTKVRDYTDVRDVVRAYALLLQADLGSQRVFNVCSGRGHSGEDLLDLVKDALDLREVTTHVDGSRLRPTDPQRVVGDNGLLRRVTGWAPQIDLATSVGDLVRTSAEE